MRIENRTSNSGAEVKADLNRCTIIVPLHDRQHLLQRLLSYLADFPINILITDSSPRPVPPDLIRSSRVEYIHVPGMIYYEKMRQAVAAVTTPYVVDVPDDDFIIKNSVREALAILDSDPGCVCVFGRPIRMSGRYGRVFPKQYWAAHVQNMAFNRPQLSLGRRLVGGMRYFAAPNHAVYRRDVLLRAFDLVLDNKHLWPIRFIDKILLYVTTCAGSVRYISRPMCIRDETRLLSRPSKVPLELEASVSASELGSRLQAFGDPLAPILGKALGTDSIDAVTSFNQKLFGKILSRGTKSTLSGWMAQIYPWELTPEYEKEILDVMAVVNIHRGIGDMIAGRCFPLISGMRQLRHLAGTFRRSLTNPVEVQR